MQYPVSWCARAWVSEGKWKRGLDLPWEKLCRKRATPAAAAAVPGLKRATGMIFNLKIMAKMVFCYQNCSSDWDNFLKILGLQPWIFKIFEPHESHISCKAFLMEDLTRIFISLHSFMPSHTNLQGIAPAPVRFNLFKQSEPFLITECFFNMFLEVSRSNKLEQLKLKLEKKYWD